MVNNNNLIKLLIENNQYCKYPPVFMFLKLNKLMPVLISTFLLITTSVFSSEKNITYMQILQKPNDLDLNLKYAQQQGKMGNY